nr:ribonuclease H-like domain-containing protein [Tanacetum cinerariifolium]
MSTHPMVTRAKAGIFKLLERMNFHVTTTSPLPRSHVHALGDPNWKEAMLDKYKALITNVTWVLVPRPANVNVVRSMWLFKQKFNAYGSLNRYKARLVANGRSQHQGSYIAYLLLYVDDIILTTSSSAFLQRIIAFLHKSKLGMDVEPVSGPTLYRSLAGALQYLTFTRPDLSYVVQKLHVSSTTQLTSYTDTDWVGCPVTRRSTSGAEAEYRGVANVVAKSVWIRNLLRELHTPLFTATSIYYDNLSGVYMSANPVQHQRTKHIEINIYFVLDFVALGQVCVLLFPS